MRLKSSQRIAPTPIPLLGALLCATLATGCVSNSGDTSMVARDTPSEGETPRGTRPSREILESDLYRLVGDQLYVYNETSGIFALDLSDSAAPTVRASEPIFGPAGELYARGDQVIVVLDRASIGCTAPEGMPATYQGSEIVVLTDLGDRLETESRICVSGSITDTRLRGDILYAVSADEDLDRTFVTSLDLADPRQVELVSLVDLPGMSREIFVGNDALFVARASVPQNDSSWSQDTLITLVDISRQDGQMRERGSITLGGAPQGRFHMDATDDTFRIVTFDESERSSSLHIVATTRPDHLEVLGSLTNLAAGENLHATRFVGDRAYVVTFRQVDPLWVIDLEDPRAPTVLGELEIPGWSDFIFPRENGRLLTVGRGPQMGIAVSLFDVSDPARPTQLAAVEFGDSSTQSEAIGDFRGAQVIEAGLLGEAALVAIPTATKRYSDGTSDWTCTPSLHLVDLAGDTLQARGSVVAEGAIRRAFASGGQLMALTDLELRSLDLSNRDQPRTTAVVSLGNAETAPYACAWTDDRVWEGMMGDDMMMACSSDARTPTGPGTAIAVLVFFAGLGLVRRKR